jgi:hypothetical protein
MRVHVVRQRSPRGWDRTTCREVVDREIVSRMGVALMACDAAPWCAQTPTTAAGDSNNAAVDVAISGYL